MKKLQGRLINSYLTSDTTNKFPDSIFAAFHLLTVRALENSDGKAESVGRYVRRGGKVRNGFVRV